MINSLLKSRKSLTLFQKSINVLAAFGFLIIWISIIRFFYSYLFARSQVWPLFDPYIHANLILFFFSCVITPLWEEWIFRRLWIDLFLEINGGKHLFSAIVFSSIIFGLLHNGISSILIQGVFGFIASLVYIYNGKSYLSCVILHFLWNFGIFMGILNL